MREQAYILRIAVIILVIGLNVCSSIGQTTFQKNYGTVNADAINDIVVTADSGYACTGYTMNIGAGSQDLCLVKTNKEGDLLWAKNYGGINQDIGNSIAITQDGGFIMCGSTNSFGAGFEDIYLVRTDSLGNLMWAKAFGSSTWEKGYQVVAVSDGGFVVVGGTYNFGAGSSDAYLLKVDSSGTQEWMKTFGDIGYEEVFAVIETNFGGFAMVGSTSSYGAGGEDIYLVLADYKGEHLWSRTYGGDTWDRGTAIEQTPDGGYIIAGFTESFSMMKHYDLKGYILKVDTFGIPEWSQTFGKLNSETMISDVVLSLDGGYCVVGYSGHFNTEYRAYAVKFDALGGLVWSKIEGDGALNSYQALVSTYDGGYVFAGNTNGTGGLNELWLTRTDSNGNNKCYVADSLTLINDTLPIVGLPTDTTYSVVSLDTSATTVTTVVLDDTTLCSNLCNVVASFPVTDSIICYGDTLALASTSVGYENVAWYLEDIPYSDTTDTFYIADSLGTYSFKLVADSGFCADSTVKSIEIVDTVIADFNFSVTNLTGDFSDSSQFYTSLTWHFGTGDSSTVGDPLYTFPDTGTYNVCLVARNNCSEDTVCYSVDVNCPYPVAYYTYSDTFLTVSFTNTTVFGDSYYWIFGDGNSSSDTGTTHTYASSGTYEVCLVATNSCGSDDTCFTITVFEDTSVGIFELDLTDIHIFQDIESHAIQVVLSNTGHEELRVSLNNILGEKIHEKLLPNGRDRVTLSTSGVRSGIYLLTLESGKSRQTMKVVLVN